MQQQLSMGPKPDRPFPAHRIRDLVMCAKSSKKPWPFEMAETKQAAASTDPTYVRSLELTNVRCFGANMQRFDLCASDGRPTQWTVLLGDNGTGKTTLLECLAAFDPVEDLFAKEHSTTVRMMHWAVGNLLGKMDVHLARENGELTCALQLETEWESLLSSRRAACQTGITKLYQNAGSFGVQSEGNVAVPSFYGYGAGRRMGKASLSDESLSDAAASLFNDKADLRNAEEWLLKLDYSAVKSGGNSIRSRQVQRF